MRARWLAAGLLAAILSAGCAGLPSLEGRGASRAFTDTAGAPLGMAVAPLVAAHPGQSGVYALADGRDAFAARAVLANAATRSLDIQYYIWRNDITGALLFDVLRTAAARGVRVRLLLDDNNTSGLDATLAQLDAHPNIEVRLFNPFAMRRARLLGYLTDFARLNRRMHNKSFTIDGQATIIGGRNIGDEYFGAAGDVLFSDLDVLAVGPVVRSVSDDFDRYWNSASAYPLKLIVAAPDAAVASASIEPAPAAQAYLVAMRESNFVAELVARHLPLEWAATRLVSDDPAKALEREARESRVGPQLRESIGEPARSVDLVSSYFVPGKTGTEALSALAVRGVAVRVLTNSLEATDVAAVHAGYAKWRKPLLAAGVKLYELRRSWPQDVGPRLAGSLGSSGSSLHAKTFAVDGERVFVGSFNFDPRSARLNTEMGLVIDSPAMARQLAATLDRSVAERAYEVRLAPDGRLYWIERKQGVAIRHDTEPGASFWRRVAVQVLSWLPIDWLL
ncbi:phospholipase D family protein [Massilia sp. R2A-15]|uniref:phospholipase D family protein n=1 Tax=Massilia sp. R2A-15 TaxID=3064278 RepID=UPI002734EFC7|nr:phospholipase D family protein [Massilia sp. R2A-15]WLI89642.1 phospholipase D family protein [Massilia sp. R2A-15]